MGHRLHVGSLVGIVLRRLKEEADRASGYDVGSVVLGHPVVFAGADGDRLLVAGDEKRAHGLVTCGASPGPVQVDE